MEETYFTLSPWDAEADGHVESGLHWSDFWTPASVVANQLADDWGNAGGAAAAAAAAGEHGGGGVGEGEPAAGAAAGEHGVGGVGEGEPAAGAAAGEHGDEGVGEGEPASTEQPRVEPTSHPAVAAAAAAAAGGGGSIVLDSSALPPPGVLSQTTAAQPSRARQRTCIIKGLDTTCFFSYTRVGTQRWVVRSFHRPGDGATISVHALSRAFDCSLFTLC